MKKLFKIILYSYGFLLVIGIIISVLEELSTITLRRTWTQVGLDLGYDTNILNILSGRSKNLGTQTALGSYTSANLKIAVSFYEQIIDRIS